MHITQKIIILSEHIHHIISIRNNIFLFIAESSCHNKRRITYYTVYFKEIKWHEPADIMNESRMNPLIELFHEPRIFYSFLKSYKCVPIEHLQNICKNPYLSCTLYTFLLFDNSTNRMNNSLYLGSKYIRVFVCVCVFKLHFSIIRFKQISLNNVSHVNTE